MKYLISILTLTLGFNLLMHAQLEKVIVEKYYISNAKDAEDIQYKYNSAGDSIVDSVKLEPGSTTYRVFIQINPQYKLTKLFGDANHQLLIQSTQDFYNYSSDYGGANFGFNISNSALKSHKTLALDTWLTLGVASKTMLGVLKTEDPDTSVLNRNGNFLTNTDTSAGIPITNKDGMASFPKINPPSNSSISDFDKDNDSTIFGFLIPGKEFANIKISINNTGIRGAGSQNNKILIAQLTTAGALSFKLNVELTDTGVTGIKPFRFVAVKSADSTDANVIYSKYLNYPLPSVCGCNDPNYLEFNKDRDCDNVELCKTKIILGCNDPNACNYDPSVNKNVPSLCCYPGQCADRDLSIVCRDLKPHPKSVVMVFPNPVHDNLSVEVTTEHSNGATIEIFNAFGTLVKVIKTESTNITTEVAMTDVKAGIYMVRVFSEGHYLDSKTFIKAN